MLLLGAIRTDAYEQNLLVNYSTFFFSNNLYHRFVWTPISNRAHPLYTLWWDRSSVDADRPSIAVTFSAHNLCTPRFRLFPVFDTWHGHFRRDKMSMVPYEHRSVMFLTKEIRKIISIDHIYSMEYSPAAKMHFSTIERSTVRFWLNFRTLRRSLTKL